MRSLPTLLPIAGALLFAASCSSQKASPYDGHLKISSSASANDTATGTTAICAQFSLQPYIPAADGTPTPSGAPVVFDSTAANDNDASAYTDQVIGCIDGTADSDGYNWGYIVTVTNFSECGGTPGTLGNPLTNVSPTTTTFNVPVNCQAGLDVEVPIHAQVAVSTANQGGYVDISAGVNATDVQIGCKQADITTTDNLLHFGESYISTDGTVAQGLVGIDTGTPNQFGGSVNGIPATNVDTFYTGDIDPATVSTIYQTFLSPCADGTSEYADTNHAQCVSDSTGTAGGTVAALADVFAEEPGKGFAAVSVAGNGLTIYSSMGDTTGPNIMNAGASGFTPSYNIITTTNLGPYTAETITGVYIDTSAPLQFLVAANVGATPEVATLSYDGTTWVLGSFAAPTAEMISCNGLYAAPASCFTPKACSTPAARCTQSGLANQVKFNEVLGQVNSTCTGETKGTVTFAYAIPANFCALDDDEQLDLIRTYNDYVKAYSSCHLSCGSDFMSPTQCDPYTVDAAGHVTVTGQFCTFSNPAETAIDAFVANACTNVASGDSYGTPTFSGGFCGSSSSFQSGLVTAYEAYVTHWLDCNSTCEGMQEPSACYIENGSTTVICPTIIC